MKKLFVSVPMRGRTDEDIKKSMAKMHKIAEVMLGEELELIDTWIDDVPGDGVKNSGVWYLGKSISMLSMADIFIGIDGCWSWPGCDCEYHVARSYDIPTISIDGNYVIDNFAQYRNKIERELHPIDPGELYADDTILMRSTHD